MVPQSEIFQIYWNLVYRYIAICDDSFWCLFFQNIRHSIFRIYLVSKSCYNCLKRLLQLLHAIFFVFLNYPNSFLKLGYSNSKYKDTLQVPFIDRGKSVKEWFAVYSPFFYVDNIIIYTFSKKFGEDYRTSNPSALNVPLMKKPSVWFALCKMCQNNCAEVIFQEKM